MNIKPNPAFLRGVALAPDAPDMVPGSGLFQRDKRAPAGWTDRLVEAEAIAAGGPTVAERLLELCPITLMDAACELDVPFKSIRGHALVLMRQGRARMHYRKLVAVPQFPTLSTAPAWPFTDTPENIARKNATPYKPPRGRKVSDER